MLCDVSAFREKEKREMLEELADFVFWIFTSLNNILFG